MKGKNNKRTAAILIVVVIVVAAVIYLAYGRSGKQEPPAETEKEAEVTPVEAETTPTKEPEATPAEEPEASPTEEPEVSATEEPDSSGTKRKRPETITDEDGNEIPVERVEPDKKPEGTQGEGLTDTEEVALDDADLTVDSIGSYAGNFLEDGSDTPTSNVAAIRVTNHSSRMLQIGQITFHVTGSETAEFQVTNLPAGASAMVLEKNKREYKESDNYSDGETVTGFIDTPSLETDKFDITTEKGKMTLKNKTDKTYSKVYVYYKYVQMDGDFMGGITYRTPFENVPAGGSMDAVANHLNPDSSRIVDVQYAE